MLVVRIKASIIWYYRSDLSVHPRLLKSLKMYINYYHLPTISKKQLPWYVVLSKL